MCVVCAREDTYGIDWQVEHDASEAEVAHELGFIHVQVRAPNQAIREEPRSVVRLQDYDNERHEIHRYREAHKDNLAAL